MSTIIRFEKEVYLKYKKIQECAKENKPRKRKPTYKQLWYSVNIVIDKIKENPYCGNKIPRKYLNQKIIRKLRTTEVFRIELAGFWRLIYTVKGEEVKIVAIILEIIDHKDYNKLFDYKNE